MYTQSICLSDICMATGDTLEKFCWHSPIQKTSQYKWPITPKPTQMEWTFWQRSLQQSLSLGMQQSLPIPMGQWAQSSLDTQECFFSKQDKALYHHTNQGWHRHAPIPKRTCTKQFHRASYQPPDPLAAAYLTVALTVLHSDQYTLMGVGEIAAKTSGGRANWQESLQESNTSQA